MTLQSRSKTGVGSFHVLGINPDSTLLQETTTEDPQKAGHQESKRIYVKSVISSANWSKRVYQITERIDNVHALAFARSVRGVGRPHSYF